MNHANKERIKSGIIVMLFIASLIQVGILWGYQNHRFPFNFLSAIFDYQEQPVSVNQAREDLFVPYRLVVSSGVASHWLIDSKDELYGRLWSEAKTYLDEIASGKLTQQSPGTADWGDITTKRGFVIEFKTGIRPELLRWFLSIPGTSGDMPTVLKMMVIPDGEDSGKSDVYIYSSEGKVSGYVVGGIPASAGTDSFQKDVTALEDDERNDVRKYLTMRDSNFDRKMTVAPDILYVATAPTYRPFNEILCTIPARMGRMGDLADVILGNEKDRFKQIIFDDGTIQFNNSENVYKVYKDGFIEYNFIPSVDSSDKGSIDAAMMNAYKFVSRIKSQANSNTAIYLSGISDSESGFYTFTFDYTVNGMPVFMNIPKEGTDRGAVTSAIVVEANSKRVLKCSWMIRDYVPGSKRNNYYTPFFNLMSNNDVNYAQMKIKDMSFGYVVDSDIVRSLEPSIIIEKKDDRGIDIIGMPVEKGS